MVFSIAVAYDAAARWAELRFSPGSTNQYGFTVQVFPTDVTNGIQFEVSISSEFTNAVPKHAQDVHVQNVSTGELSTSAIAATNGDSWARFVFVIPSNDLDKAEFMWSQGYEGFYKKLGGAFHRVNLKQYYEYHRTTPRTLP